MDIFASSENHKLPLYVSYLPDSNAFAVNAFSLHWKELNYAFPPFSLLGPIIKKVNEDNAELVLIAPLFITQAWFPQLLRLVRAQSYILPKVNKILSLPGKKKTHPLTSMRMAAFRIAGDISNLLEYHRKLPKSSWNHGDNPQSNSMGHITKSVVRDKLITLTHL